MYETLLVQIDDGIGTITREPTIFSSTASRAD